MAKKHCDNCGKALHWWQVQQGPTGIFCSSECFLQHWKTTPAGKESIRLKMREEELLSKLSFKTMVKP